MNSLKYSHGRITGKADATAIARAAPAATFHGAEFEEKANCMPTPPTIASRATRGRAWRIPAYVEPEINTSVNKATAASTVVKASRGARRVENAKKPIRMRMLSPIGNFRATIAGK